MEETIATRLDEIRRDAKLKSIRALAIAIGVDDSQLSKVYNGERPLTDAILNGLETTYGIKKEWISSGAGPKYGLPADKPLSGNITVQDHINLLRQWREDAEAKYQDAKNEKAVLLEALKTLGINLKQGQDEIKRQIQTTAEYFAPLLGAIPIAAQANKTGSGKAKKNLKDVKNERGTGD